METLTISPEMAATSFEGRRHTSHTRRCYAVVTVICAVMMAALALVCAAVPAHATEETAPAITFQEGAGVTRLTTPYYSVFLEDRLFPDGFAYEYLDEQDGAYGVLNVYAATELEVDDAALQDVTFASTEDTVDADMSTTQDGSSGYPAYRIYCIPAGTSTEPFAGTYATAQCGTTSDGAYLIVVARPYGAGFSSGAAAQSADASDAALRAASSMADHIFADTTASLVATNDGFDIVTPWYTVSIPRTLFPNGWYYTYSDAVIDYSSDGSGAYMGRMLSVIPVAEEEAAFSVCCLKNYSVQGDVTDAVIGVFEGEWAGWQICIYRVADPSRYSAEEELSLLQPYANLVTLTTDPAANPPVISEEASA